MERHPLWDEMIDSAKTSVALKMTRALSIFRIDCFGESVLIT